MNIPLDGLQAQDEVVIQDNKTGNVILGEVMITYDRNGRREFSITAFGTKIIFAKDRSNGLGPRMLPRLKLTGHTQALTNVILGS